jgi:hypothetical protein
MLAKECRATGMLGKKKKGTAGQRNRRQSTARVIE